MKIKISKTNSKLGGFIPSINLPAGITCRADAPCQKGCYAKKGNWTYKNVQTSLNNNFEAFKADPEDYFNQIISELNNGDVTYKFFRWHSSGDIVNLEYLKGIIRVAETCPNTIVLGIRILKLIILSIYLLHMLILRIQLRTLKFPNMLFLV